MKAIGVIAYTLFVTIFGAILFLLGMISGGVQTLRDNKIRELMRSIAYELLGEDWG